MSKDLPTERPDRERSGRGTADLDSAVEPEVRLDDQLCFALYAATSAIVRAYRPLLRDMGLTYPQYVVLMALWERDDVSVGDLGARLGLPLGGLTPVLDRLERVGLLARRRGEQDRRVVLVSLTEVGRALEQDAARVQHRIRCQLGLSPEAFAALRGELRALVDVLDGEADEAPGVVEGRAGGVAGP